ncbi:ABC transporter ATP-binding protein [Noviherbaspirillum soli]|uniref:ABC transporter ATP-binding protein n=1 Tax=Noviherbaspirillum soli TaxID=1064518 RepID=UPI00188B1E9B|nr:ABC transporter ATP-binding protein [Noviherbaspirillum soli]
MNNENVLEVCGLKVEFSTKRGKATVLNDVSFTLAQGEILGIVGESGCGKSITSLAIMGLIPSPPGHVSSGRIMFKGEDLTKATSRRMRELRGNEISMIFQEPMTSLNPVFTIGDQISETLILHLGISAAEARLRSIEMLRAVGIPGAEYRVDEYPHQISGGMRQRVMIAMALACQPSVLIADEPTTALDVTVQAQIFDLLRNLKDKTRTAIMLITHDMGVIAEMTDRVVVMYGGRTIESGYTRDILSNPQHPYTRGLIACIPKLDPDSLDARKPLPEIPGMVPSLWELNQGCPFAARCSSRERRCDDHMPPTINVGSNHHAACWLHAKEEVET